MTPTDKSAMLPLACPFCGGKPHPLDGWGNTKCKKDGCPGASVWVRTAAWNTRTQPKETPSEARRSYGTKGFSTKDGYSYKVVPVGTREVSEAEVEAAWAEFIAALAATPAAPAQDGLREKLTALAAKVRGTADHEFANGIEWVFQEIADDILAALSPKPSLGEKP